MNHKIENWPLECAIVKPLSKFLPSDNVVMKISMHMYIYICNVSVFSLYRLQLFGPWPTISFLILNTVGRTFWTGDQSVARPLSTLRTT
jgi:hypothetical protein